MKAVIQTSYDKKKYVVTFEDGRQVECKDVFEAMEVKNGKKKNKNIEYDCTLCNRVTMNDDKAYCTLRMIDARLPTPASGVAKVIDCSWYRERKIQK